MDEATYKTWWELHRRVALGESLSAEKKTAYETGIRVLDEEEERTLVGDLTALHQARERVAALESEAERLRARRTALKEEIAALEATK